MDASLALPLLIGLIGVALFFDFMNGMHDAANSVATIVATRVLSPQYAVAWAAFFNFIAFLFFGLHVAQTLGTGIINPQIIDPRVIFAALMGAIAWNVITWRYGIPSSSSHALVGGLLGVFAARMAFGPSNPVNTFLPGFLVEWSTVGFGLGIAIVLGLVSGLVPAWQAGRLSVVDALRRVA